MLTALLAALVAANSAAVPEPRNAVWLRRHEELVAEARRGGIEVLFLGDSLTEGWLEEGRAAWERELAPLRAANFGISGDRVQNLLWRLRHGEAEGFAPRLVVLLIGTNNLGLEADGRTPRNSPHEIALGIEVVVSELRERFPSARILLLALLPRDAKESLERVQAGEVNAELARLHDGERVHVLDVGARFLDRRGRTRRELMPDRLHLNPAGYAILAEALRAPIRRLLGDEPRGQPLPD